MEGEKFLLNQRQLQKWHLMKRVEVRIITLKEVGEDTAGFTSQAKRIAHQDSGDISIVSLIRYLGSSLTRLIYPALPCARNGSTNLEKN